MALTVSPGPFCFHCISLHIRKGRKSYGIPLFLVVPWGHFKSVRKDLELGMKSVKEEGTGTAERFWDWSEEQVKAYA